MSKKTLSILMSIMLLAGFVVMLSSSLAVTPTMKVHFITLRQGDEVVAYLKQQKVDEIEILIATHPGANQLSVLDKVLKAFKVGSVYAPKVAHKTDTYGTS